MKSLSSLNNSKSKQLKMKEDRLEREKGDICFTERDWKLTDLEIKKNIDALCVLSRNLKEQRKEYMKEKRHFLAQAEQRTCKNCGHPLGDLGTYCIQDAGNVLLPNLIFEECSNNMNAKSSPNAMVSVPAASGGLMSWLQKLFKAFCPQGKRLWILLNFQWTSQPLVLDSAKKLLMLRQVVNLYHSMVLLILLSARKTKNQKG
ncbi:hypothetical protein OPV22_013923 [Ensete ventricosum]|uniref:MADS-box domain-containing protein n=1 Tax=Ensete ventricosum TaxID=4639 RepID=A0AAV8QWN9_ENSVE|nr:hypothetical protein OPV22_013923 [Ensete ventricosum]